MYLKKDIENEVEGHDAVVEGIPQNIYDMLEGKKVLELVKGL